MCSVNNESDDDSWWWWVWRLVDDSSQHLRLFFKNSLSSLLSEALCYWIYSVAGDEIHFLLTLLCLCSLQSSGTEEMVWEQYTVTLQRVSSFTNCAVNTRHIRRSVRQPEAPKPAFIKPQLISIAKVAILILTIINNSIHFIIYQYISVHTSLLQ